MAPSLSPNTPPSLLLRLGQAGDSQAWPQFVRLYTPVLLAWGSRLGLGPDDAADLSQDVFARVCQALPGFAYDPSRRFRGWLWTVLINLHREQLRRRGVAAGPLDTVDTAVSDEPAAWVEEEYRRHLVSRAIRLMRTDFPEPTWRACWGMVVEGRHAADVARELGTTPAAVYKARTRVLLRLRQELEGLLD